MLDRLNLRPQERRFVVIAGLVVFLVINIWFVWPHFGDWGIVQNRTAQTQRTLKLYQDEIARVPSYQAKQAKLQAQGSDVLSQELDLQRNIQAKATSSGVLVTRWDPRGKSGGSKTNQFFEEQLLTIDCTTGPKELVTFLVDVAAGNSMIRVREMNLRPDGSQTKLLANITFVASYQKKVPVKPVTPAPTSTPNKAGSPPVHVSKPAATPSPKQPSSTNKSGSAKVPTAISGAKSPGKATNAPAAPKK
jgi:hypothetical protein